MVDRNIELKGVHGSTVTHNNPEYEIFYLLLKFIDTGSPVPSITDTFWIRKGNTCSEVSGMYTPYNFHTGKYFTKYSSLSACESDKNGDDANSPHEGGFPGNTASSDLGGRVTKFYYRDDSYVTTRIQESLNQLDLIINDGYGLEKTFVANGGGQANFSSIRSRVAWSNSPWSCDGSFYLGGMAANFFIPEGATERYNAPIVSAAANFTGAWTSNKITLAEFDINKPWLKESHLYNGWINLEFEFFYDEVVITNGGINPNCGYVISAFKEDHASIALPENYKEFILGCPPGGGGDGNEDRDFGEEGNNTGDNNDGFVARHTSRYLAEVYLCSSRPDKNAIKLFEVGCSDLFSNLYDYLAFVNGNNLAPQNAKDEIKNIQSEQLIDLFLDKYIFNGSYAFTGAITHDKSRSSLKLYPEPSDLSAGICGDYLARMFNSLHQSIFLTVIDETTQSVQFKSGLKNVLSGNMSTNLVQKAEAFSDSAWEFTAIKYYKITNWISSEINRSDYLVLVNNDWQKELLETRFLKYFNLIEYSSKDSFKGFELPNPENCFSFYPVKNQSDDPMQDDYAVEVSCFLVEKNEYILHNIRIKNYEKIIERDALYPYVVSCIKNDFFNGKNFAVGSWKYIWNKSYIFSSPRMNLNSTYGTILLSGSRINDLFYIDEADSKIKFAANTDELKQGDLSQGKIPTSFNININDTSGLYRFFRPRPEILPAGIFSEAYTEDILKTASLSSLSLTSNFFSFVPFPHIVNHNPFPTYDITPYVDNARYIDGELYSGDLADFSHRIPSFEGVSEKNNILEFNGSSLTLNKNFWGDGYYNPYSYDEVNFKGFFIPESYVLDPLNSVFAYRTVNEKTSMTDINNVFWEALVTGTGYYYVIDFTYDSFIPNPLSSWINLEVEPGDEVDCSLKNPVHVSSGYVKVRPPKNLDLGRQNINNTHVHCVKAIRLQ